MARIVWASSALRDPERLRQFLSQHSPDAARRAARTICRGVRSLAGHPEKGRPFEGLPSEFREWFIQFGDSGYIAVYRYDGQSVTVLALRHGKEIGFLAP